MKPETPPPASAVVQTPTPPPDVSELWPGQLLLVYTPEGPLGGTFTCTGCKAQAWQPDLLVHGAGCPFVTMNPAPGDAPVTPP